MNINLTGYRNGGTVYHLEEITFHIVDIDELKELYENHLAEIREIQQKAYEVRQGKYECVNDSFKEICVTKPNGDTVSFCGRLIYEAEKIDWSAVMHRLKIYESKSSGYVLVESTTFPMGEFQCIRALSNLGWYLGDGLKLKYIHGKVNKHVNLDEEQND